MERPVLNLPHELAAPSARREHRDIPLIVPPHRRDASDAVLPRRQHGGNRAVLGAKLDAATYVHADPGIDGPALRLERAAHVADEVVADAAGVDDGDGAFDEVVVGKCHLVGVLLRNAVKERG